MPNSILRGISFKESALYGSGNCSSVYEENFLSSLNVRCKRFSCSFPLSAQRRYKAKAPLCQLMLIQFCFEKINNICKRDFFIFLCRSALVFNRSCIQATIANNNAMRNTDQLHIGKHKAGAHFSIIK